MVSLTNLASHMFINSSKHLLSHQQTNPLTKPNPHPTRISPDCLSPAPAVTPAMSSIKHLIREGGRRKFIIFFLIVLHISPSARRSLPLCARRRTARLSVRSSFGYIFWWLGDAFVVAIVCVWLKYGMYKWSTNTNLSTFSSFRLKYLYALDDHVIALLVHSFSWMILNYQTSGIHIS